MKQDLNFRSLLSTLLKLDPFSISVTPRLQQLQHLQHLPLSLTVMGLSGGTRKQKIPEDPRNTKWATGVFSYPQLSLCVSSRYIPSDGVPKSRYTGEKQTDGNLLFFFSLFSVLLQYYCCRCLYSTMKLTNTPDDKSTRRTHRYFGTRIPTSFLNGLDPFRSLLRSRRFPRSHHSRRFSRLF